MTRQYGCWGVVVAKDSEAILGCEIHLPPIRRLVRPGALVCDMMTGSYRKALC